MTHPVYLITARPVCNTLGLLSNSEPLLCHQLKRHTWHWFVLWRRHSGCIYYSPLLRCHYHNLSLSCATIKVLWTLWILSQYPLWSQDGQEHGLEDVILEVKKSQVGTLADWYHDSWKSLLQVPVIIMVRVIYLWSERSLEYSNSYTLGVVCDMLSILWQLAHHQRSLWYNS